MECVWKAPVPTGFSEGTEYYFVMFIRKDNIYWVDPLLINSYGFLSEWIMNSAIFFNQMI